MSELLSRRIERRTRQRATNRATILDAARRIAGRHGEGNLSLRSVAAEAGYAPASVYEYFRNRAELVIALATDDLASVGRELRDKKEGDGSIKAAAAIVLNTLRSSGALPAAVPALAATAEPSEAEKLFNGKLIAALTAFAEASGLAPLTDRRRQADVILAVCSLIGLSVLSRAGRLSALSLEQDTLIEHLSSLHSPGHRNIG
jgi:AcrR family transcriptional regulator